MATKKVKADWVDHVTKVQATCPYCGMECEDELPLNIEEFTSEIVCGACEKMFLCEVTLKTYHI